MFSYQYVSQRSEPWYIDCDITADNNVKSDSTGPAPNFIYSRITLPAIEPISLCSSTIIGVSPLSSIS